MDNIIFQVVDRRGKKHCHVISLNNLFANKLREETQNYHKTDL